MIDKIALFLLIVGGLNWGSIGIFGFDFVSALTGGPTSIFARVIFTIVGVCAIWCFSLLFRKENEIIPNHM